MFQWPRRAGAVRLGRSFSLILLVSVAPAGCGSAAEAQFFPLPACFSGPGGSARCGWGAVFPLSCLFQWPRQALAARLGRSFSLSLLVSVAPADRGSAAGAQFFPHLAYFSGPGGPALCGWGAVFPLARLFQLPPAKRSMIPHSWQKKKPPDQQPEGFLFSRSDVIRTRDLCVPNFISKESEENCGFAASK